MIRRFAVAAAIALAGVTLAAAYTDVTFVMKNGERVSGTFSYNHTDHYQVIVNGRERDYPSDNIALLVFAGGDPTADEINRLPTAGDPPELERHTIVLRSGEMIRGKIYDFQGDRIIMDMGPNDRRTFSMNDTARLYISAPGARALFANAPAAAANSAVNGGRARGQGRGAGRGLTINVPTDSCWSDTGISVVAGQNVSFVATGEVQLSVDRNDVATPAGSKTGRPGVGAPVPAALLGSLIARIDNNQAFPIGDRRDAMAMPQAGRLWLGVNDGGCGDNSGAFRVTVNNR